MTAFRRHSPRDAVLLIASAAAAATLAGCASDSLIARHEPAASPACPTSVGSQAAPMLGCANRANLEAMVANPGDLQQGRILGPAIGAREAQAVEAYKKGQTKKLGSTSTTSSTTLTAGEK